jgi:hypothetical protein
MRADRALARHPTVFAANGVPIAATPGHEELV